jgi:hypothetical protein
MKKKKDEIVLAHGRIGTSYESQDEVSETIYLQWWNT